MTDKKFTDEEIIKALEYCNAGRTDCDKCVLKRKCESYPFHSAVAEYALDLINRQKAEIERLKGSTVVNNIMKSQIIKRGVKSRAYKEFAEKLEEKLGDCHIISDEEYCGFDCGDIHGCIDTLLKEMVGEEE